MKINTNVTPEHLVKHLLLFPWQPWGYCFVLCTRTRISSHMLNIVELLLLRFYSGQLLIIAFLSVCCWPYLFCLHQCCCSPALLGWSEGRGQESLPQECQNDPLSQSCGSQWEIQMGERKIKTSQTFKTWERSTEVIKLQKHRDRNKKQRQKNSCCQKSERQIKMKTKQKKQQMHYIDSWYQNVQMVPGQTKGGIRLLCYINKYFLEAWRGENTTSCNPLVVASPPGG